jgi:hypothetical protein
MNDFAVSLCVPLLALVKFCRSNDLTIQRFNIAFAGQAQSNRVKPSQATPPRSGKELGKETVKFLALFDHHRCNRFPSLSYPRVQRFNRLRALRSFAATFLALFLFGSAKAHANVYATNIRLNGGATNVVVPSVTNLAITYILNEPATLGVTININSGASPVRTIALTSPGPGTLQGSNYVAWDGRDNASNPVPGGLYTVSIVAGSSGYTNWTETSSETNVQYQVESPRGIAVNRNTSSPYYGRVFVANANEGINPDTHLGDQIGILKFNADSSFADEGGISTGGYDWTHGVSIGNGLSPWKLEVGPDDRLYANDFSDQGLVFSFDQLVSTNSLLAVLRPDNYPTNSLVIFDGPFISGSPGNMQIWMADTYANAGASGAGVHRWNLTAGGTIAANDMGVMIVQPGVAAGLDQVPADVSLDTSNRIYTIQDIEDQGDLSWRVLRFPAYTNVTETNANWRIGSGDDSMAGATAIAVDPTATYVAVAFKGYIAGNFVNGSTRVFYASNGAPVVTFAINDDHYDVAWDNVGNLYTADGFAQLWRSYSPPGTNQATTVAISTIQIGASTAPFLSNPSYSRALGQFQFTLNGQANATYVILSSTDLVNWAPVATNTSTLAVRQITNSVSGPRSFFRARLGP